MCTPVLLKPKNLPVEVIEADVQIQFCKKNAKLVIKNRSSNTGVYVDLMTSGVVKMTVVTESGVRKVKFESQNFPGGITNTFPVTISDNRDDLFFDSNIIVVGTGDLRVNGGLRRYDMSTGDNTFYFLWNNSSVNIYPVTGGTLVENYCFTFEAPQES